MSCRFAWQATPLSASATHVFTGKFVAKRSIVTMATVQFDKQQLLCYAGILRSALLMFGCFRFGS
jgi:hypothetical protein